MKSSVKEQQTMATTKSTYEPEGMVDVRLKFSQLKTVIGTFNEKVSDVLTKAEVQFLQAYRGHMQAVYAEKQVVYVFEMMSDSFVLFDIFIYINCM